MARWTIYSDTKPLHFHKHLVGMVKHLTFWRPATILLICTKILIIQEIMERWTIYLNPSTDLHSQGKAHVEEKGEHASFRPRQDSCNLQDGGRRWTAVMLVQTRVRSSPRLGSHCERKWAQLLGHEGRSWATLDLPDGFYRIYVSERTRRRTNYETISLGVGDYQKSLINPNHI